MYGIRPAFPIGYIYLSTDATDPSIYFEGEWQLIRDRFLLTAGDTYSAGTTGGEATHTLTVEEMPVHKHIGLEWEDNNLPISLSMTQPTTNGYYTGYNSDRINPTKIRTGNAGGGQAHNNMPPYLVVYAWERIG